MKATGISLGATCKDLAGNTGTASYMVRVDKTAPTVALTGGPADGGSYYFGPFPPRRPARHRMPCPGSLVARSLATALSWGHTPSAATATDRAGNGSTVSATYTVLGWSFSGFYPPVDMDGVWNTVKGGSTVPLKFRSLRWSDRADETRPSSSSR